MHCPKVFANISTKYPYPYSYNVVIVRAKSDKSFRVSLPPFLVHCQRVRDDEVARYYRVLVLSYGYTHIYIHIHRTQEKEYSESV